MAMPIDGGRDIALVRNPSNGKFDFGWDETNNPAFDDSDSNTVLSALLEHAPDGYWADPTGQHGSTLHVIKEDVTGTDVAIGAAADGSISRIIQRRLIRSATTTVKRIRSGRFSLDVKYQNRDGHDQNTKLPIGG